MQILQLYVLRDVKADYFAPPLACINVEMAYRACRVLLSDSRSEIAQNPADFQLYHIGSFTDKTGVIEAFPQPVFVITVSDLFRPPVVTPSSNGKEKKEGGFIKNFLKGSADAKR